MKLKEKTWLSVAVLMLLAGTATARDNDRPFTHYPLIDSEINLAIAAGTKAKGKACGLSLRDSFQSFSNSMAIAGGTPTGSTGFGVDVYTPFAWIAQNASWEAKKYRELELDDVTEEMKEGVLRVFANPDMPTRVSPGGMAGTSGVEHIIIRSTPKKNFEVLQPLETVEDIEYAQNAFGAEVALPSMAGYFALEDVVRISTLDKKGEFFVVVIGTTGEEKKFKIKTKHFKLLP